MRYPLDPAAIKPGAKDGFEPIHQAAKEGHPEALGVLIEAKANVEAPAMVPIQVVPIRWWYGQRGVRALHMASRYGHKEVVELLIKQSANLRACGDVPGRTGRPGERICRMATNRCTTRRRKVTIR